MMVFRLSNIIRMKKSNLIIVSLLLILIGCKEEDKYSGIVYKNYLAYEIKSAKESLTIAFEGDEEGEYASGSKQIYQNVIDKAEIVNDNEAATQTEVDQAYADLLQADTNFYDAMMPYRSDFLPFITYGQFVYNNTNEGTGEGEISSGYKEDLDAALTEANNLYDDSELTQNVLEGAIENLSTTIYSFNAAINGTANLVVKNYSFENPGYATDSFEDVYGWGTYGTVEDWASNAMVISNDSTTDGDYAAMIGSYTTGIYQSLNELVNPSSEYKLKADISLISNDVDWEGDLYPVVIKARIVVFMKNVGDYNFVEILSEIIDTIGTYPTSFQEIELPLEVESGSSNAGKKMGVDFILRHTFDSENPIYAESYLSLDNVRLTRTYTN